MNITVPIPAQDLNRVLEKVSFDPINKTIETVIQNHILGQGLESSIVPIDFATIFASKPQAVRDAFTGLIEEIFAEAAQRSINDVVGGFLE